MQGICLAGFTQEDAAHVSAWFQWMEPGLPICCISDDMLDQPLEQAVFDKRSQVRIAVLASNSWSAT
jgi:hypothetical protein